MPLIVCYQQLSTNIIDQYAGDILLVLGLSERQTTLTPVRVWQAMMSIILRQRFFFKSIESRYIRALFLVSQKWGTFLEKAAKLLVYSSQLYTR